MSENARDTQFAGFALLLIQEIDEQVGAVTKWGIEHAIDDEAKVGRELASRWQILIARRAYDLVMHVLNNENEQYTPLEDIGISDIPDLTAWTEEGNG